MGLLVLTSAAGAPGVTSLAVGLALCWPRSVILVDADPAASQAVLAGFLGGRSAYGKGLLRVAEAHRDRRPLRETVIDQCLPLSEEPDDGSDADPTLVTRRLLPGFTRPGSAALFGSVWPELSETLAELGDSGIDVVVDAGRLTAAGLPAALVEYAALTCLVTGSSLRAVMAARVQLPSLVGVPPETGADPAYGVVVVGPGEPYSAGEIGAALGVPVLATIARDDGGAAHLSDGRPRPRRFERSALARSLHGAADLFATRLERSAERIGSAG